ncbi:MAG: hypothetical protein ACPGJV_12775 [Bacteriovoracaceae bacterium]
MSIGETIVYNANKRQITSGIDDKSMRLKNGTSLKKNEIMTLVDSKGQEFKFKIIRIIGGDYLILVEDKKKPKLSFLDSLGVSFRAVKRRTF